MKVTGQCPSKGVYPKTGRAQVIDNRQMMQTGKQNQVKSQTLQAELMNLYFKRMWSHGKFLSSR